MSAGDDKALEHAWNYFALHANQRITVFNYFVVFAGILGAGIGAAVQASPRAASVGIFLGALLIVLSYVFWKIDQRTAFLIKHAEEEISAIEPSQASLLSGEVRKTAHAKANEGLWTYGKAFRTIFAIMALIGVGGVILSTLRLTGDLEWSADKIESSKDRPVPQIKSSGA